MKRLLHREVTGCADCPAHYQTCNDRGHLEWHICNLDAREAPINTLDQVIQPGVFASDCPLPDFGWREKRAQLPPNRCNQPEVPNAKEVES